MLMEMKKYLVVLGRGIEGCGVTKIAIEFTNYVNSLGNGYEAKILANNDKKWGRENCHKHQAMQFSFANELDKVKEEVSKCNVVFAMSVPAKKFDDASKDGFCAMLEYAHSISKHVVLAQWDHKIQSISRNMYADEKYFKLFENVDLMLNHSYTNDFAIKFIKKNGIHLKKLVCRGDGINNLFGIDFEALKKPFWKPIEQKDSKTIKFIGRSAGWKGPWKFRDLHASHFKSHGYISTIEGIELSIGVLPELYKEVKPNRIPRDDVKLVLFKPDTIDFNNGKYVFEKDMPAYILPPYNHDEAMERLSRCQFAIELIMMDDNLSKDIIENAMMEMVAVGCVPVFRKRWGEMFTVNGKPLAKYGFDKTGTVFLDEDHPETTLALMDSLANDKEAYEKARNAAYSFYKETFDNEPIYSKVLNVIESSVN